MAGPLARSEVRNWIEQPCLWLQQELPGADSWFETFISRKSQVARHLVPPASLNLASTSIVLECSTSPCFALLTVDPDPGILSCGSTAESRDTVETFCQESGKVNVQKSTGTNENILWSGGGKGIRRTCSSSRTTTRLWSIQLGMIYTIYYTYMIFLSGFSRVVHLTGES